MGGSVAVLVVGVAVVAVVGHQPCRSTMCFDWATSTMAERSQPGVRGGLWYGVFAAVLWFPIWGLPAFATGALSVRWLERRRPGLI
jgi:hypothetical protein